MNGNEETLRRGDVCGGTWRMGRRDTGRKERGRHPWRGDSLSKGTEAGHIPRLMHSKRRTSIPTLSLSSLLLIFYLVVSVFSGLSL